MGSVAARRLVICLGLLLAEAAAVAFTTGRGQQTFAAFGAAKQYTLPVVYLVIALAIVLPAKVARGRRPTMPAWVWLPSAAIGLALIGNALIPGSGAGSLLNIAQGLALFGGFSMLAWFGLSATEWSPKQQGRLVALLLLGALVAGATRAHGFTPFVALAVPGFFSAVVLLIRSPGKRPRYFLLAVLLGALMVWNLQPDPNRPTSAAVLAQVAACAAVVLLVFVPRVFRPAVLVLGLLAVTYLFFTHGGPQLLSGHYQSTDVTIAQRSYEAAQVDAGWQDNVFTLLVGHGPGATVDLASSPDAGTLLSSGRNLHAVDDVHLLTAYLVLKVGLVGLAWLLLLVVAVWKVTVSCVRSNDPGQGWRLFMLLFVIAGVVNAFPAATNLFVNPLVPLFLGVLWATRGATPRPQPSPVQSRRELSESHRLT